MQHRVPGAVSTFYMGYLQAQPDARQPVPASPQQPAASTNGLAGQSTRAGAAVGSETTEGASASAAQPLAITFLYRCHPGCSHCRLSCAGPCFRCVWLHRLTPGIADRSFGLNVARLAHLPGTVIQQASAEAAKLEQAMTAR